MTTESKFSKAKASKIVEIIANATDYGAQVLTLRGKLAVEFKGFPRKPLADDCVTMLRDAFRAEFESRDTVSEKSVGPMTSEAVKVATWMPVILGLSAENFAKIGKSWKGVSKFATELRNSKGDVTASIAAVTTEGKKNYRRSACAHLKALIGMKDGKFLNAAQKALIVALADDLDIDLREKGEDARNPKLAASVL